MSDIVERLRDPEFFARTGRREELIDAAEEIERLRAFVGWVDSWVSNPVGSYSVHALDGLFHMTRDRIAANERWSSAL